MFSPKFSPKVFENSVASPRIDLGLKSVLGHFPEFAPRVAAKIKIVVLPEPQIFSFDLTFVKFDCSVISS